jgi:hypothetical protein
MAALVVVFRLRYGPGTLGSAEIAEVALLEMKILGSAVSASMAMAREQQCLCSAPCFPHTATARPGLRPYDSGNRSACGRDHDPVITCKKCSS